MRKIIEFGKVAASGGNTKRNLVTLEVELKETNKGLVFSVCGNVWNHIHTDTILGGQCLDSIWSDYGNQLKNAGLYRGIMGLWKKWHLNNLHAECTHQEKRGWTWENHQSARCWKCGWKLGHGWNYREIEPLDLKRIRKILA